MDQPVHTYHTANTQQQHPPTYKKTNRKQRVHTGKNKPSTQAYINNTNTNRIQQSESDADFEDSYATANINFKGLAAENQNKSEYRT